MKRRLLFLCIPFAVMFYACSTDIDLYADYKEIPIIYYMFTDIRSQSTEMLYYGPNAERLLARAFNVTPKNGKAILPGIVSRKKQVIPALMTTLQRYQEEQA